MGRKQKKEADSVISVFRRSRNGELAACYSVKFTLNGKQILKSTGCHEEDKAVEWANDYVQRLRSQDTAAGLAETVRRIRRGGKTIELDKAFSFFRKAPKRRKPSEKHLKQQESVWDDFRKFVQARHPNAKAMGDITERIARSYITFLQSEGRFDKLVSFRPRKKRKTVSFTSKSKELSPKTCNTHLATLQHIYSALQAETGLDENPFSAIPKLRPMQEDREAFSPEQLKLIGEHADGFLRPIFTLGLYTGLRVGDICTLQWREVNLKTGWITRKMHKTGKTVRVPILPALHSLLAELPQDSADVLPAQAEMYRTNPAGITYRIKHFLGAEKDEGGLGFTTTRKVDGRTRVASVLDAHSLRHTFCWLAAQHGIALPIVQSIVGHLTPNMTQSYSNHATDQAKVTAMQALPDYMGIQPHQPRKRSDAPAEEHDPIVTMQRVLTDMTVVSWKSDREQLLKLLNLAESKLSRP